MVPPGNEPIPEIDIPHCSIKHALRIVRSTTTVIPSHEATLVFCGFSAVMMVDDWLRIVRTGPSRGRDPCQQSRFIPAVECSGSEPWIETADLSESGPAIGDIRPLNQTGSNKTTCRKRKRLQGLLDCYFAVCWIIQKNTPADKTKFWISCEAIEY